MEHGIESPSLHHFFLILCYIVFNLHNIVVGRVSFLLVHLKGGNSFMVQRYWDLHVRAI